MFTSGTAPPVAVNASWPPLTEPFEASVVAVAQSAVLAMPKRTSLSAMLPPLWPCPCVMFTPESRSTCEPCCSAGSAIADADREHREHRGEHQPGVARAPAPSSRT